MNNSQINNILPWLGFIALLAIFVIALIARNLVREILSPLPHIAGPLASAVALFVFVYLAGKGLALIIRNMN